MLNMKSENKNFLYNIIYQLLTFVIPLVVTPYISRVLGVDNVGIYSYTYSIVYMFMLIGMLGINNYGNRSIAAVRDDKDKLAKTFWSIYLLQLLVDVLVVIGYVVYLLFICKNYKTIAIIQGLYLLSVCFDVNWFYFGIEKFKLTITRNLIIKVSSLFLIFLFVKNKVDLPVYTIIMAGATFFSQLYLVILLPKYTIFAKIKISDILVHVKSVVILFVPVLAFGIYKVMDKTMLGYFSSVTELGYYENAEKLLNIPSAIIAALGTVMLPRMSYLLSKEDSGYRTTLSQSMTLAMKLSTMMFSGVILISNEVVLVLFGGDFTGSIDILKVLSITIIASAWANVIRTQYLIPLKKDNIYILSTVSAAVLNFILNMVFIPRFGGIGACIGTIGAEYLVAIIQTMFTWKELDYIQYLKRFLLDLIFAAVIVCVAYSVTFFIEKMVYRLILKIAIACVLFLIINYRYLKTEFFGIKG